MSRQKRKTEFIIRLINSTTLKLRMSIDNVVIAEEYMYIKNISMEQD